MTKSDWFIFGAGFSGLEIGRLVSAQGIAVAGTTRSDAKFARLEKAGLEPHAFDGLTLGDAAFEAPWQGDTSPDVDRAGRRR